MPREAKWAFAFAVGGLLLWVGWKIPIFLTAFFVTLSFILTVIILLQSGSAADLAGAFGGAGSQTAFGPRAAATFLTKATAWCAVMFMVSALLLSMRSSHAAAAAGVGSVLEHTPKSQTAAPAPKAPPAAPKQTVPTLPVQQAPANPGSQAAPKPAPAAPAKH
jgi:preprotein translocase subunit SecG